MDEVQEYDPKLPRPGRWILRFLGLWLPDDAYLIFKIYYYLTYTFPFLVLVVLTSMCIVDDKFNFGMLMNSLTTALNLCCPFVFCRWYFYAGHFNDLVKHIEFINRSKLHTLAIVYSLIMFLLWMGGLVFFYFHWLKFFDTWYKCIVFGLVLLYSIGWWASWITTYGFACNLLYVKLHVFETSLSQTLSYSTRTPDAERKCVVNLLNEFNDLSKTLKETQTDFSKIISFSVLYHIMDLFVFTTAYKCQNLGYFSPWKYYGGVTFDLFSVFTKLYPAAVVCQKLHRCVIHTGRHCCTDYISGTVLKDRLLFYQHIVLREQDLGLCVLGVKITSKLLLGIFFTVSLGILRFLYYAIPIIQKYFHNLEL